jgi:hypothetical protein
MAVLIAVRKSLRSVSISSNALSTSKRVEGLRDKPKLVSRISEGSLEHDTQRNAKFGTKLRRFLSETYADVLTY